MVLANASLDIAFHDKLIKGISILVVSISSFLFKKGISELDTLLVKNPILLYYITYLNIMSSNDDTTRRNLRKLIYAYITGILDAKQIGLFVNHNKKKKRLEFSIRISLPYFDKKKIEGKNYICGNKVFLGLFCKHLSGNTRISKDRNTIFWYLSSLEDKNCIIIDEMLDFWKEIPFFSLKMRQNLKFFVKCYKDKENIQQYLNNVKHIYKKNIPPIEYELNNIDSNKVSIEHGGINGYKSIITLNDKSQGNHFFLFWLRGYIKINGTLKTIGSFNKKKELRITSNEKNIIDYIAKQFFFEGRIIEDFKIDDRREYNKEIQTYKIILNKKNQLQHFYRFINRSNFTNNCLESAQDCL